MSSKNPKFDLLNMKKIKLHIYLEIMILSFIPYGYNKQI